MPKASKVSGKPVVVCLKFICPSAKDAEEFAKEVQGEFNEVSDVIPQMTGWTIKEDGFIVHESGVTEADADPATGIPYGEVS